MNKKIALLGSTGSIGTNTLRVTESLGSHYEIYALTAHSKYELLAEQARKFNPAVVALTDPQLADKFKNALGDYTGEVLIGPDSLCTIAKMPEVNTVVTAIVGAAGLPAVLTAAEHGKTLAIANKEPLVIAGELLTEAAAKSGAKILPIDSEHSAIFQCLQAGKTSEVQKIILTASGGPFRTASPEQIKNATLEDALDHPTWSMGPKITVDSATMMNKALEVIEAVWLFGVPVDKIEVLVHPESIVHSLVEFVDGSVMAQLGAPDMCTPIQYALTYPDRETGIASHLDLAKLGQLSFEPPNLDNFRALKVGFDVAAAGGSAPVVFNAANEAAVKIFLEGGIKFARITELIEECVDKHQVRQHISLEELLEVDKWAREFVSNAASKSPTL
ncbi:1-deoxy-D-xylulose 5-phosphate reductoisomerase [Anaerohalosphaera lusitana]|uniref:1-deoxy-D-xylulose 5-phosphate reductoisomerase n=1 Tax=Anaerohalosphaera lusitana TaxID=1936003 RepID=A0A1U9NNY0_9BACT|nr:1-deoxy-D-xylulose-5-phosphate reductoisomerase [Anaerohalosphaera lusitana]AQT69621.1 1-deoxy-D-xylulose 5-phosphate reductoisomerase [Anaerohalosphaera lusitana]